MQICILCVGKMKERYWLEAAEEYIKRLSAYAAVAVEEVPDQPVPDSPTLGQQERILREEADKLLYRVRDRDWVVALTLDGRRWTSEEFAHQWDAWTGQGAGRYVFVIGGTLGLHDRVIRRANATWSLSPLTFPHQLARVIVLEQLYRAFQILRGGKYHR
ncbi:MAG: 23S rRNA (pseudouridine(1915)-N(3))-methyltransferase RlmH [Alicyclobacillaceae bacterium]|nr:23S rRNA (pseudouridine(1915)-N(3))-methyltransferase RlmH [Alicyclobacillaceae bacterium]